ncbi:hypothetical protein G9P44_001221 [Scheffersomyces stipitis]|nr:hypothetical protein G9P44_001221 [Scheffersomyces stipitis]
MSESAAVGSTKRPTKTLYEKYVTPKLIKDVKFFAVSFLVMCAILFHYAYIMRQLYLDPYMPMTKIAPHAVLFIGGTFGLGYLLLFVYYPKVYAEEIAKDKAEVAKAEAAIAAKKNK